MDDLFDGWLSVPAVAGFLLNGLPLDGDEHSESAARTVRDKKAPTERSQSSSPQDINERDQSLEAAVPQISLDARDDLVTPIGETPSTAHATRQRRGHTKSRLGCIACKKRKVKCQETWPSCANCVKRGTACKYPPVFKDNQRERSISEALSPCQPIRMPDTPLLYSSKDMQLFHHYITVAHPFIPHDYHDVWTKYVPGCSQEYPFLMNAMLALAGSHLDLHDRNPQRTLALQHRQKAIAGLEEAFTRWPPSANEAHVMLAASYLLSFQSNFLTDGFLDHILSLRGCASLSQLIMSHEMIGVFIVQRTLHSKIMENAFKRHPHVDQGLAREALASLQHLGHSTRDHAQPIEKAMIVQLVETLRPLLRDDKVSKIDTVPTWDLTETTTGFMPYTWRTTWQPTLNPLLPMSQAVNFDDIDWNDLLTPLSTPDPIRGFNALMGTLTILATWPHEALMHLFDPNNTVGRIILAHFCAVRFIITPLSAPEEAMRTPVRAVVEWASNLVDSFESDTRKEWKKYVQWPEKIVRCMQANLNQNPGLTFTDMRDMIINDPGAFKEGRARRPKDNGKTVPNMGL